jgi:hypothetical protein
MKKIYSLIATMFVAAVASAQTMYVHLKDGSTVSYAAENVDYVDFDDWTLVSSNIKMAEYYGSIPAYTVSLYKSADGSKYKFANFAKGVDLEFTLGTESVKSQSGYDLGYYIYPTGGSSDASYPNYWYFSDDTWIGSLPLQLGNWENKLDYAGIYLNTTYSVFNPENNYGWLCLYGYLVDSEGNYANNSSWYYVEFYEDTTTGGDTEEGGDSSEEGGTDTNFTLTLADVAGSYTEATTGYWNADCNYTVDVTIEVADEATNTVTIKGFSGSTENLTGVVDLDAKTITIAANQAFSTYYVFSAADNMDNPVVATIASDGTISLKSWGAWYNYGGTYYNYAYNMVSTLTKK